MRSLLRRVPIPMAGLALGMAALGNLLKIHSPEIRSVCGLVAAVLWCAVVARILRYPEVSRRDLQNPIIASVAATIFMTAMQLAVYAKGLIGDAAVYFWFAAVAMHAVYTLWFSRRFLRSFRLKSVYPTFFITYVGIVVASVTAPQFGMERLGTLIFWYGLAAYLVLLALITLRYYRHPIPIAARPLFCIYTAPMSLCLTGYLCSCPDKSPLLLAIMGIGAQLMFLIVLCRLPRLLHLPFYPSYAAFTFPFVITAFGLQNLLAWFEGAGYVLPTLLHTLLLGEEVLAACLVVYAMVRYIRHISCGLQDADWDYEECRWCCT